MQGRKPQPVHRFIARHLSISRRQIERRFREQLGVTLLEEIRRVRVERAKRLLAETDWDMPEVSQMRMSQNG